MIELTWELPDRIEGLEELLNRVSDACFAKEGIEKGMASMHITDDENIRSVNLETRGKDMSTDVLSFPTVNYPAGKTARDCIKRVRREYDPTFDAVYLGDIVLSLPTAASQAHEYGHPLAREIGYLTAHACFHLLGYDHMNEADKAQMRVMEESVMDMTQLTRDTNTTLVSDAQLFALAKEAMQYSYSPYSGFRVGACLLSSDGRTFQGANIENASYGATICAERCAVSNARMQGAKSFTAIAVVGSSGYAWPCGICRQVLNEFSEDMKVICGPADGEDFTVIPLSELLPMSFGPKDLGVEV